MCVCECKSVFGANYKRITLKRHWMHVFHFCVRASRRLNNALRGSIMLVSTVCCAIVSAVTKLWTSSIFLLPSKIRKGKKWKKIIMRGTSAKEMENARVSENGREKSCARAVTQVLNRHFLIVEGKQKYFCTVFHWKSLLWVRSSSKHNPTTMKNTVECAKTKTMTEPSTHNNSIQVYNSGKIK